MEEVEWSHWAYTGSCSSSHASSFHYFYIRFQETRVDPGHVVFASPPQAVRCQLKFGSAFRVDTVPDFSGLCQLAQTTYKRPHNDPSRTSRSHPPKMPMRPVLARQVFDKKRAIPRMVRLVDSQPDQNAPTLRLPWLVRKCY
jgi:hypothetical protein